MKRLLPELDVDVVIEHGGHQMAVSGSGKRFVARFQNLGAIVHFGMRAWPFRKLMPSSCEWQVEWKGRRFPSDRSFSK